MRLSLENPAKVWRGMKEAILSLIGSQTRDEEELHISRDGAPMRELERLSGSRRIVQYLNDPIALEGSTAPADMLAKKANYWGTERIVNVEAIEDVSQVWKDIRAVFRGRSGGREGAILSNHQGALAIKTAFEILDLEPYGEFAGVACNLVDARKTVDFFRHEAGVWPDGPGKNFSMMADIIEEAIIDARVHGKDAIAIIDTTSEGYEGPTLAFAKEVRRHEAFHVWQRTVNPDIEEMLPESVILDDPDYIVPEIALADYYPNMTPNLIVDDATAMIASGDHEAAGFPERAPALRYLDRYLQHVVKEYGIEVLDGLRLVHPDVKEVIDHVRAIAKNDIGRAQESPGEGTGADGQTGGRTPFDRGQLRSSPGRIFGGWLEENGGGLRGNSQESGYLRSSGQRVDLSQPDTKIGFFPAADVSQATRGVAELTTLPTTAFPQNAVAINGRLQVQQEGIAVGLTTASRLKTERVVESMEHPEQRADEIFLTNIRFEECRHLPWQTKRLGQEAYRTDGSMMGEASGSGWKPVFIKRHEVDQALSSETDQSLRHHYQNLLVKDQVAEMSKVLGEISRGTTATDPQQIWADTVGRAREVTAKIDAAGLSFSTPASYMVNGLRQIAGIDLKGFPDADEWESYIAINADSWVGAIVRESGFYDERGLPNIAGLGSDIAGETLYDVYGHGEYTRYQERADKHRRTFDRELAQVLREVQTSDTIAGARVCARKMLNELYRDVEREERAPEIGSPDFETRYLMRTQDAKIMISALDDVAFRTLDLGEAKSSASRALTEANAKWNPFLEAADLSSQLRKIAEINSVNRDNSNYTWQDLTEMSLEVVDKADLKVVNKEWALSPADYPTLNATLTRISNIGLLDVEAYSFRDKVLMIQDAARGAPALAEFGYEQGHNESFSLQVSDRNMNGMEIPEIADVREIEQEIEADYFSF